MQRADYLLLVLLAAMWGLSFAFYRVGAPALGPALFAESRVALAGGVLLSAVAFSPTHWAGLSRLRQHWRAYALIGLLNSALPFTLIAIAELRLPASYASILNATAPLFSLMITAGFLGGTIRGRQALGLGTGILGVSLLVGVAPFSLSGPFVLSVLLSLLAALSYAIAALFIRARLKNESPVNLSVGQLLTASLWLAPFAAVEFPSAHFTGPAIFSVLGIVLACTVLAYVIYFRILQRAGATQALTVTFLTPIFGVAWASVLLGEPIGLGILLGVPTVLVGVALVHSPTVDEVRRAPEGTPAR